MQTKAAELAGTLEGKTIFYVKIETPNGQDSIDETTLERQQGIAWRVEGNRIIFTAGETAAGLEVLETAQILTSRAKGVGIVVTLASNGGLQIKYQDYGQYYFLLLSSRIFGNFLRLYL
jgi:hypothetical protein